jgi:hypothetical protein
MSSKLSKRMSLRAFETGYWYASDLIEFGKTLGLPAHRMRKNELESAIKAYLSTGRLPKTIRSKPVKRGVRDLDKGLTPDLVIANYTSNRATKDFIVRTANCRSPGIREKSGVWYRLNRWREAQVAKRPVTYGQLVDEYIALNRLEHFARIPHGRYINFMADYLAAENGASRNDAIAAWKQLKHMEVPKTYEAWRKVARRTRPS